MTSVEYDFHFNAGIYISDALHFNSYKFTVKMYPGTDQDYDHNVAFERIRYLIDGIVSLSVFVLEDDHDAIMKFAHADIPVLTIPYPGPVDQMIQFVLAAKINAIIEGTFNLTDSWISSTIGNDIRYAYSYLDEDDEVESLLSDSIQKWWNSSDPRFVTVFTDKEAEEFEPATSWEDLDMLWYDDIDFDNDVEFEVELNANDEDDEKENNILHFAKPKKPKDES